MSDERHLTDMTAADWRERVLRIKSELRIAEAELEAAVIREHTDKVITELESKGLYVSYKE